MTPYEFLGAFGVGGLLTALVQFVVNERSARRRIVVQERREAYLGFLSVFSRYVHAVGSQTGSEDRDAVRAELAHWHARVFLVSSKEVGLAAKELIWSIDRTRSSADPKDAYSRCLWFMRKDIGISDADARGAPFKDWLDIASNGQVANVNPPPTGAPPPT